MMPVIMVNQSHFVADASCESASSLKYIACRETPFSAAASRIDSRIEFDSSSISFSFFSNSDFSLSISLALFVAFSLISPKSVFLPAKYVIVGVISL